MQRSEPKRAIGIPQSTFDKIEKYARDHTRFIFEVVCEAWEEFEKKRTASKNKK